MVWFHENELWIMSTFLAVLTSFIVAVLYEDSPKFRYKFKFCLYTLLVCIVMLIFLPISLLRPRNVKNLLWTQPFFPPISRLLGLQWEIQGAENLDKDVSCVFICNHQTILDILGMYEIWPRIKRCAPVAKKEILYVFPFGIVAWLCGAVFIDRGNTSKSKATISTTAETLKKDKTKLWIFPEGTRHKGTTLLPFKKGAFHIAIQNKLPIVPVLISPYTFIDDEKTFFNNGRMIISVLPPIETDGIEPDTLNEFIESTRNQMVTEYERLSQLVIKSNSNSNSNSSSSSSNSNNNIDSTSEKCLKS